MAGTVGHIGAPAMGANQGISALLRSFLNPTSAPTAQQNPSTQVPPVGGTQQGDNYNQSADLADEQESPEQQQLQQLEQQVQQDMQQLATDQASGNQQAVQQDMQQLGQDEAQLQALMGGGQSGGASPTDGSSPAGGGGGAPASGGASPSDGGGGSSPSSGGSSPSSGGSSPASGGSSPTSGGSAPASGSGSTYDGASGSAAPASVQANAKIVAQIAQQKGVDPTTAVATMLVESGGNNQAVGDGGTSFGLFQLHQGGELGSLSQSQAEDPSTNANVALSQFASTQKSTGLTGGALAAASQRPANPSAYAAQVNSKMAEAKSLIG